MARKAANEGVTDLTRGVYKRIYAGLIHGKRLNKLSIGAEAWFWRVLVTTDDFGNEPADKKRLFHNTIGLRDDVMQDQVFDWVHEMEAVGLIKFYEVEGETYLHISGFTERQPGGRNGVRVRRYPESPWDFTPEKGIQVNPGESHASAQHHYHNHNQDHNHNQNTSAASAADDVGTKPPAKRGGAARGTSVRKEPSGPHHELIRHHAALWRERCGGKYPFADGKDAAAIGRILKGCDNDLSRAKAVVSAYMADSDAFFLKTGFTLAILAGHLARFLAQVSEPTGGRPPTEAEIAEVQAIYAQTSDWPPTSPETRK